MISGIFGSSSISRTWNGVGLMLCGRQSYFVSVFSIG
jgi:hypothetical protein